MVCKEIIEIVPPYQQKQINDTLGEFFSLSASLLPLKNHLQMLRKEQEKIHMTICTIPTHESEAHIILNLGQKVCCTNFLIYS